MKLLAALVAPIIIAQGFAFGDFIYEESIQAAGMAVRAAMQAEDQTLAYANVKTYEALMKRAQAYHAWLGCLAFWSADAYHCYFWRTAPAQLVGFYAEGIARKLWRDDVRRYAVHTDRYGKETLIDTWRTDPATRLAAYGFDPELLPNRNCPACRGMYKCNACGEAASRKNGERIAAYHDPLYSGR